MTASPARATATPGGRDASLLEHIALARQFEPERYLAATLAPAAHRDALIALAAFAADLQRIPATATQPMLGEIRLQWWRDSLDLIGKGARIGSPLADGVASAIKAHNLPIPLLSAMSEARAWDLYDDPMADHASLDGYLSKTEAIPFELALRIAGLPAGDAGALSQPAGRAFGLTRLLANLPAHLATGRLPFPQSAFTAHAIDPADLLAGRNTPALKSFIQATARDILGTVASLRPQLATLTRPQRVALLPLSTIAPYLKVIDSSRRDAVRDIADLAPFTRVWRMTMAHVSGRF